MGRPIHLPQPLPMPPLVGGPPSPPPTPPVLAPEEVRRLNEADDAQFYSTPRMMHHVDEAWRQRLTGLYTQRLRPGWRVLDLCSSAHSHLPPGLELGHVTGHGMNAAELAANPQLHAWFVHDLNREPQLRGLGDASMDVVLCCCGLQYLTQPEAVLAEVRRVLRPGGPCIIAFTDSSFLDKAVAGWLARDTLASKAQLVKQLLAAAGLRGAELVHEPWAAPGGASSAGDPFVAVVACKQLSEEEQAAEWTPPALRQMGSGGEGASAWVLERWVEAYRQMAADVQQLGVPASAIPPLPPNATEAEVRAARDLLSGMLASFLSAGL